MLIVSCACILSASTIFGVTPASVERQDLSIDQIYQGFKSPPSEARPFVRWWWNNDQVEKGEILRELDLIKAAGMGGVEINPIAGREGPRVSKAKVLTWRSKEWDSMLHVACKGAKERGLTVDLIAGSGWPFGGEFLKPDEQIMRVMVLKDQVSGPVSFRQPIAEILKRDYIENGHKEKLVNPVIEFVSLYPKKLTSMDQVRDVTGLIDKNGVLKIDIEKGDFVLAYGIKEHGYYNVYFGVKGAAGPTMDHMQKRVTRLYLNRLIGVEDSWGEPLSTYVRAIFCDSIETAEANWTTGMAESFKKRNGYDIRPYLPFVIGKEAANIASAPELTDLLRRVRYDWSEHNSSTFLNNFTSEYAAFCHDHNLLSRYQAYGIPFLMGMAEGYMIPDIPESNNWLYSVDPLAEGRFTSSYRHGYMIWTKYASAAGRLRGKKIISTEAMTNTKKVFKTTLGTIKQSDDMNFIAGMTHSVLHGFNYVPPDVPFPGFIRFGSYFSEYNTWWNYLPLWVDYNARLSYVFQETRAAGGIALLGPKADVWSKTGLSRAEFHSTPDYFHKLWEPLSQLGSNCDYLHENVIQGADMSKGMLRYGPMAYRILIVADMETMQADSAEAIQRFAESGGRVVYVNKTPCRSPGLVASLKRNRRVAEATAATLKAGARVLPGPKKGADATTLRSWVASLLKQTNLSFAMKIDSPRDGLYSLSHNSPNEKLLFFTNTYRHESSRTHVTYKLGAGGLWHWNPETGERTPYDMPYDEDGFDLDLRPLESILLVTGVKQQPDKVRKVAGEKIKTIRIDTPWTVEFKPARSDTSFSIEMKELTDFTKNKDKRVNNFAGTAIYTTSLKLKEMSCVKLDLGWDNDCVSEVEFNGKKLGVNWYGSRIFDLSKVLKTGDNVLTIRYTTTLWNKMKRGPLHPSGLMGPVTLQVFK